MTESFFDFRERAMRERLLYATKHLLRSRFPFQHLQHSLVLFPRPITFSFLFYLRRCDFNLGELRFRSLVFPLNHFVIQFLLSLRRLFAFRLPVLLCRFGAVYDLLFGIIVDIFDGLGG